MSSVIVTDSKTATKRLARQRWWYSSKEVNVGNPPAAFTTDNIQAAVDHYLRDKTPISLNLALTGITAIPSGTGPELWGGTGRGGGSV